jgi:hypothetical protein
LKGWRAREPQQEKTGPSDGLGMAGVVELSCVKTGGFSACVSRYGFLTQTSLTLEIAVYLTEAGCSIKNCAVIPNQNPPSVELLPRVLCKRSKKIHHRTPRHHPKVVCIERAFCAIFQRT